MIVASAISTKKSQETHTWQDVLRAPAGTVFRCADKPTFADLRLIVLVRDMVAVLSTEDGVESYVQVVTKHCQEHNYHNGRYEECQGTLTVTYEGE